MKLTSQTVSKTGRLKKVPCDITKVGRTVNSSKRILVEQLMIISDFYFEGLVNNQY